LVPDGARITTVIAADGQEFVTTRTGNVIRVEAATVGSTGGDWQVWHDGRIIRAKAGAAEFAVLPAREPLPRESKALPFGRLKTLIPNGRG
jgi:hypothetical protein